ncbi:hypothetical protein D3C72_2413890 [compost metagenome]
MERRIEIDVLAHIIAEEIISGVDAAQGNQGIEVVRISEKEAAAVIGAHRAA